MLALFNTSLHVLYVRYRKHDALLYCLICPHLSWRCLSLYKL